MITEDEPTGVDSDKLLTLLGEGTLEDDGTPVRPLETGPEGEVVLRPEAPLGAGLDDPTELLEPSPAVVTELEAGGTVALLGDPELFELTVVPGDGAFVVVGDTDVSSELRVDTELGVLGAPVGVPGLVDTPDNGGNEEPEGPADGDDALSVKASEDVEAVSEEERTEVVTSPVDKLEGPSLTPPDAELVGELEMVLFDAELGGFVTDTLELPLSDGLEAPGDEGATVPSGEVGKTGVVPEIELPDAVMDASVLGPVLETGMLAEPGAGTVPDAEVGADPVLLALRVALVPTAELGLLLADPEASEDISLDAGLELAREDGAEISGGPEDDPVLGVGGLDRTALEVGPLETEGSVYGPPVDDVALDTVGNELIVQVSTLVVVRPVIWEVDELVAIVVTWLVVTVKGRVEA